MGHLPEGGWGEGREGRPVRRPVFPFLTAGRRSRNCMSFVHVVVNGLVSFFLSIKLLEFA